MSIEASNAAVLKLSRHLRANPHAIFDALVNPATMRRWMIADPDAVIASDLRAGGFWTITTHRGGQALTATGRYEEVHPPQRLVYTYGIPQFSPKSDRIAIDILADAAGSQVTLTQSGTDIAAELGALAAGEKGSSQRGWEQGFDALARLLESP